MALLDSAGVPVPAVVDVSLLTLCALNPSNAALYAGLCMVASTLGSLFLFGLARRGGQAYLDRHTRSGRGALFKAWFLEYGLLTIFIPALLPIPLPLKVFVLSAGALGVRPMTFGLVMLAARVPRYAGLAYLGARLGQGSVAYLKSHVWHFLGFAAVLFLALYLLIRWRKSRTVPADAQG